MSDTCVIKEKLLLLQCLFHPAVEILVVSRSGDRGRPGPLYLAWPINHFMGVEADSDAKNNFMGIVVVELR